MMRSLAQKVVRFIRDEDGPTAVEYAFLLTLILLAALVAIRAFGVATNTCIESSQTKIDAVIP